MEKTHLCVSYNLTNNHAQRGQSHVAEPSCKLDLPELKPDVFPSETLKLQSRRHPTEPAVSYEEEAVIT